MLFCCALSDEELFTRNELIEELIERMGEEGIDVMDELYELIKTDVYAFALSKTGNPRDAEDIMQDTFVQIYRYAKGYTSQGKPLAWVFTIVTNLANRKHIIDQRSTYIDEEVEETSDGTDFENDVINNEFIKQIMQVLSQEEQEIIVMHIVSGLKHAEIAKVLGKPISTVLSRYNRAIKKLQKSLQEL